MMIHLSQINWLAVLLASFAFWVLGALWFVVLFAKPYAAALGRTGAPQEKPGPLLMFGPLVCAAVITVTNAVLMHALGVTSSGGALEFGGVTGAGYLVAMTVTIAINPNFPRPLAYGAVNGPYFLLANLVSCYVLAAMA